jgi:hypothetical protein
MTILLGVLKFLAVWFLISALVTVAYVVFRQMFTVNSDDRARHGR